MISDHNNHVFMAVFFDQWSFIIIFIPAWKQRDDHDVDHDVDPGQYAEAASDEGEDYANKKKRWR